MQDRFLSFIGQALPRQIKIETIMLGQALQHLEVELIAPVPALDRAAGQTQIRVGDDAFGVEKGDLPEAVAMRARTHRIIERKEARFEFGQAVRADRAGEFGREPVFLIRVHFHRDRTAIGVAQRGFERFSEPLFEISADFQAVDDDFNGVLFVLFQLGQLVQFKHFAIDTHPHKTLRAQLIEEVHILALAADNHRRKDHQLGVFRQGKHMVNHLADGLARQRLAVFRAERRADARKQKTQVIVDFGDRADG